MKILHITVFAILLFSNNAVSQTISQQVINSTGNTASAKTLELSWSVGEMAIATLSSSNIVLTEGFLQPDISAHNSGIEEINISDLITVFPNPVHDQLYIKDNSDLVETVSIYNALGQRLIEQNLINPVLDMSLLMPGIYFVNLINRDRKEIHTFKIIKY